MRWAEAEGFRQVESRPCPQPGSDQGIPRAGGTAGLGSRVAPMCSCQGQGRQVKIFGGWWAGVQVSPVLGVRRVMKADKGQALFQALGRDERHSRLS